MWIKPTAGNGVTITSDLNKKENGLFMSKSKRILTAYANQEQTIRYDRHGTGTYKMIFHASGNDGIYGEYVLYSSD